MKIIAVTQDQMIIKDGVLASASQVGGYQMTRGEWAVYFDTTLGVGHIEYLDSRPNETLTQAEYDAHYQWLESKHQDVIDYEAKQAAVSDSSTDSDSTAV